MRMPAVLIALLLFAPIGAQADELVSGLSQDTIQINSNYTGTEIVVFGAIQRSDSDEAEHDVVVVVRGPDEDFIVHKKDRVAGLWLNRDQAQLQGMPSFYYLASARPIGDIASQDTRQRYDIGLANLSPRSVVSHHDAEPFRKALIRQHEQNGLYSENFSSVEFLSSSLFRARIAVPASVSRGQYNVEVYLFHDGLVESAQSTPLFIDQTGMERRLFNFARQSPFYYGVSAVLMAVAIGWLSSLLFRRRNI